MNEEETITISKKQYDQLMEDSLWLQCLSEAGVDNWSGIDEAWEILSEYEKDLENEL